MPGVINLRDELTESLNIVWDQAAHEVNDPDLWMQSGFAEEVPMPTTSGRVPRMSGPLVMAPWEGARKEQGTSISDYTWKSEKVEATLALDRDEMSDLAAIGRLYDGVQALGKAKGKFKNEMVFPFIEAAQTSDKFQYTRLGNTNTYKTTAYDGVRLLGTHPNGGHPFTNIDSGGAGAFWYLQMPTDVPAVLLGRFREIEFYEFGDDVGIRRDNMRRWGQDGRYAIGAGDPRGIYASNQGLDPDALKDAIIEIGQWKNEDGTPANLAPTKLVVSTGRQFEAREVLKEFQDGGASNVLNGIVTLQVVRYFTD